MVTELRKIYEIVWGEELDPRNFHCKVTGVQGFLVPTVFQITDRGGPAAAYCRGPAHLPYPTFADRFETDGCQPNLLTNASPTMAR